MSSAFVQRLVTMSKIIYAAIYESTLVKFPYMHNVLQLAMHTTLYMDNETVY